MRHNKRDTDNLLLSKRAEFKQCGNYLLPEKEERHVCSNQQYDCICQFPEKKASSIRKPYVYQTL